MPLKVYFGEKGNNTFIQSKNFVGIIDYLEEKNIESAFIETNVIISNSFIFSNCFSLSIVNLLLNLEIVG